MHFEPTGHSARHNAKVQGGGDVAAKYRESIETRTGGHEGEHFGMPPYIIPGSEEEKVWRAENGLPADTESAREGTQNTNEEQDSSKMTDDTVTEDLNNIIYKHEDLMNDHPEHIIDRLHEIRSHLKAGLIIAIVLLTFRAYLRRIRVHADKSRKAV